MPRDFKPESAHFLRALAQSRSLKSTSEGFLLGRSQESHVCTVASVVAGLMCWKCFWHRRFNSAPPREPPSGLMKDFLNLAHCVSVGTQWFFSARVGVPRFPSSSRCGGQSRDGVLGHRVQEPNRQDMPPRQEICSQSLCTPSGPAWDGSSYVGGD